MASVINGTNIVLYKYDTNKQYYFNGSINQGVTVNGFGWELFSFKSKLLPAVCRWGFVWISQRQHLRWQNR